MNRYAISDIHGCFYTFKELLSKIGLTKNDELYLLGDYINRGPSSKKVIDYIVKLQNQGFKIATIKGNHEEMIFDSIELDNWVAGSEETLKSFKIDHLKQLDEKYIKWFSSLLPLAKNDEFIFVHAGLNFKIFNPLEDEESMLWIDNWYETINYNWLGNRKIIHGHAPIRKNQIERMVKEVNQFKVLNIDNGCYMKEQRGFGNLCCIELDNMDLFFQKNID